VHLDQQVFNFLYKVKLCKFLERAHFLRLERISLVTDNILYISPVQIMKRIEGNEVKTKDFRYFPLK